VDEFDDADEVDDVGALGSDALVGAAASEVFMFV